MPSGRTHDRITLWSLPLVAGLSLSLTRQSWLTLMVCSGFLFGGLMLGPDLDIHSVHYKRWGWLRWIWIPYRGSLRHRSPISHGPVTGTVVRVVYLLSWLGFLGLAGVAIVNQSARMGWTWDEIGQVTWDWVWHYRVELLAVAVGLEIGAFSHYTADWLVSSYKRVRSKGWQALKPKAAKTRRSTGKKANQAAKPRNKA